MDLLFFRWSYGLYQNHDFIIIYRFADIVALNKFYFIISKEFELSFVFDPLCHYL